MDIEPNNKYKKIELKVRHDNGAIHVVEFLNVEMFFVNAFMIIQETEDGTTGVKCTVYNLNKLIAYKLY